METILVYKFRPGRTGFNMYAEYTQLQLTFLAFYLDFKGLIIYRVAGPVHNFKPLLTLVQFTTVPTSNIYQRWSSSQQYKLQTFINGWSSSQQYQLQTFINGWSSSHQYQLQTFINGWSSSKQYQLQTVINSWLRS